ncbi:type II toxin-antitoxin system VapC family toxin [Candidatus Binatia bacterium]|nr:type II toxin-antitoxin system VapC family toxin [Candidatus Binatia bacterium]
MAFLLDTNILSELRKGERGNSLVRQWFSALDADDLYVSVLVVGEIRRGIELLRARDAQGAIALDRWLNELERRYADHILPVTLEICRIWGGMSLARPLAPIDGLMAATAVYHGMILVTRNVKDVGRSGAAVFNPCTSA